jgi:hypothetical protein
VLTVLVAGRGSTLVLGVWEVVSRGPVGEGKEKE